MTTFTELQSKASSVYGLRDKLYLHVYNKSISAFDKADRRRNRIKTKADFLKYQKSAKNAFIKSIGKIPYDKNLPLDAEIVKSEIYDGIRIENIIFQSRENIFVTANFYVPENATTKLPGILMQCGHNRDGRLVHPYRRVCTTLAKAGLAVLVIDPMGQGERQNYFTPKDSPTKEHQYCGDQCLLAGEALTKYFLADAMRAVDYLQSRPEVDADKIGATGSSGGGTMTAALGVADDRVKAAAPGTFITTRRDYMYAGGNQDSEQIWPGTTQALFDHYELISCFCPKPYLILGVKSDFFCREGTEKVFEKGKEFYGLFDKKQDMRIFWDDSMHAYTPALAKAAAEFFCDCLADKKVVLKAAEPIDDATKLFATKTGQLRTDQKGDAPVFEENKAEFLKKRCKNAKDALLKNIYANRDACAFHVRHLGFETLDGIVGEKILWFTQKHLPCFGGLFKPENKKDANLPVTICLWQYGTDALAEHENVIREITASGRAAFVADLSAMGKCAPHPLTTDGTVESAVKKFNTDLLFLGDSICAIRAYEVIKTLEMLKEEYSASDISIYTIGNFCVYPQILKRIGIDVPAQCVAPVTPFDIITNQFYDNTDIVNISMPGIGLYLKETQIGE